MGPRSAVVVGVVGVVAGWSFVPASAQTLHWLRAEGVGTAGLRPVLVEVDERSGRGGGGGGGGAAVERAVERVVEGWFERCDWVYGLGTHGSHNYTALVGVGHAGGGAGVEAEGVWEALPPVGLMVGGGAVVFGAQMREREVDLALAEFAELCVRAGVEWTPRAGERVVRVRRVESARVIVREGGEARSSEATTAKRGERVEIRPVFDPTLCTGGQAGGGVLPVRLYVEGDSVAGATVIATHVRTGATQRATANDKGVANLHLDRDGAWRVEFHAVIATPAGDPVAWRVYTATLAFETAWADGANEDGAGGGR